MNYWSEGYSLAFVANVVRWWCAAGALLALTPLVRTTLSVCRGTEAPPFASGFRLTIMVSSIVLLLGMIAAGFLGPLAMLGYLHVSVAAPVFGFFWLCCAGFAWGYALAYSRCALKTAGASVVLLVAIQVALVNL